MAASLADAGAQKLRLALLLPNLLEHFWIMQLLARILLLVLPYFSKSRARYVWRNGHELIVGF